MMRHDFLRTKAYSWVYFKKYFLDGIKILLYVDDIFIVGQNAKLIYKLKKIHTNKNA